MDRDIYGNDRPTHLIDENYLFGPVTEAIVVACLADKEGKLTDPKDIVNGYENRIIFFDKYGKPHTYRLIIGGEHIPSVAGKERSIAGTCLADHCEKPAYSYDGFVKALSQQIEMKKSQMLIFYLYLSGGETGSDFVERISQNTDIYLQIVEALKTGEGFPENLPEDFFIWAFQIDGHCSSLYW